METIPADNTPLQTVRDNEQKYDPKSAPLNSIQISEKSSSEVVQPLQAHREDRKSSISSESEVKPLSDIQSLESYKSQSELIEEEFHKPIEGMDDTSEVAENIE